MAALAGRRVPVRTLANRMEWRVNGANGAGCVHEGGSQGWSVRILTV